MRGIREPAISRLALAAQQIELMIAEQALRMPQPHECTHELDDRRTVGSAISEVTHEDESPALQMPPDLVVTESPQQFAQRSDLAVHVTDDIDGPLKHLPDRALTHDY